MIRESVAVAESGSVEDLELQEAALKASNMVGKHNLHPPVAGFLY